MYAKGTELATLPSFNEIIKLRHSTGSVFEGIYNMIIDKHENSEKYVFSVVYKNKKPVSICVCDLKPLYLKNKKYIMGYTAKDERRNGYFSKSVISVIKKYKLQKSIFACYNLDVYRVLIKNKFNVYDDPACFITQYY